MAIRISNALLHLGAGAKTHARPHKNDRLASVIRGWPKLSGVLHFNSSAASEALGRAHATLYQKACMLATVVWINISTKNVVHQQHAVQSSTCERSRGML